MISGDAPISSFLPVRFHREFLDVLSDLKYGDTSSLSTVKAYCSELYGLLNACKSDPVSLELVSNSLQALVEQVKETYRGKINPTFSTSLPFLPGH